MASQGLLAKSGRCRVSCAQAHEFLIWPRQAQSRSSPGSCVIFTSCLNEAAVMASCNSSPTLLATDLQRSALPQRAVDLKPNAISCRALEVLAVPYQPAAHDWQKDTILFCRFASVILTKEWLASLLICLLSLCYCSMHQSAQAEKSVQLHDRSYMSTC